MKREHKQIRVKERTFTVTNSSEKRILCGHLFLADNCTDECSIAMEPINEAVFEAAPGLVIDPLYPNLKGVELLCGHRFSASHLVWYWLCGKMVCPVCRREFPKDAAKAAHVNYIKHDMVATKLIKQFLRRIKEEAEHENEQAAVNFMQEEEELDRDFLQNHLRFWVDIIASTQDRFRTLMSPARISSNNEERCTLGINSPEFRLFSSRVSPALRSASRIEIRLVLQHDDDNVASFLHFHLTQPFVFQIPLLAKNGDTNELEIIPGTTDTVATVHQTQQVPESAVLELRQSHEALDLHVMLRFLYEEKDGCSYTLSITDFKVDSDHRQLTTLVSSAVITREMHSAVMEGSVTVISIQI
jgi:hypothetical protein